MATLSLSEIKQGATSENNASPSLPSLADIRGKQATPELPTLSQIRTFKSEREFPAGEGAAGIRGGGTFARGVSRGAEQSAGLAGQLLKLIGDETGFAGMVDLGDELIEEAFVEAVANPARIDSLDEAFSSFGNAGTFIMQTLGEQIPNLAVAAISGGIGAYAAKAAVGKAALKNLAAKSAAGRGGQFVAKDVRNRFFKSAAGHRAVLKGAAAGTFTGFLPINTGEIIQEQRDAYESVENQVNRNPRRAIAPPQLGPSLILGALSSGLEVLGFGLVGKAIFGKAKKEVIEHTLGTVLRRIGHVSLQSLAAEGGTEAVQEAMVIASRKINDPTFSITDAISSSEGLSRIAFAGVSGAVVGGILGGGGGVATSVSERTRAGLRATSLRGKVLPGIAAMNAVFKTPTAESEEAESLFDFRVLAKKYNQVAAKVANAGKVAFAAAKNKLSPHDQNLAVVAAREQQRTALDQMDFEEEEVKKSVARLRQLRVDTMAAFVAVRNALSDIIGPSEGQERGKKRDAAIEKMSKQVNELLDKAKKASVEERAQLAEQMLSMAQALAARAEFDPLGVSKRHIKSLLSAGQKYASKGFNRVDTGLKNSLRVLANARLRVANSLQGLPEATQTEATEQQGATTSQQEINDSIDAVATTGKAFAFAVGSKVENIAKTIVAKVKKLGLVMRQDKDRVVIAKPENIDKDPDAESFTTPIADIEAPGAVATTRNEEGRVVGNEAIPATVEAAQEATERGATEIRTPAEAITESAAELNREAEQTVQNRIKTEQDVISQVYRAVTNWLNKSSRNNVTNIPADLVVFQPGEAAASLGSEGFAITWSEFSEAYSDAEHLAGTMLDMSNKFADPEAFLAAASEQAIDDVQDLENFIEQTLLDPSELFNQGIRPKEVEANTSYFGVTKNNRIVPVDVTTHEDGTRSVKAGKGVELGKPSKALSNRINQWSNTGKKPAMAKAHQEVFTEAAFAVFETIDGVTLIRTVFKAELDQSRIINQVRKAKERGNNARFSGMSEEEVIQAKKDGTGSEFVVKAKDRQGHTVWFHLGEITALGSLLFPQRAGGIGFTLRDFWEGMASLMGDFEYVIDFNAKRPSDRAKAITGKITYDRAELAAVMSLPKRKTLYRTVEDPVIHKFAAEDREAAMERGKQVSGLATRGEVEEIDELGRDQTKEEFVGNIEEERGLEGERATDVQVERSDGTSFALSAVLSETHADTIGDSTIDREVSDPTTGRKTERVTEPQVTHTLTNQDGSIWDTGKTAVDWLIKKFSLKNKIITLDEDSLPARIAGYQAQHQHATLVGDQETADALSHYIKELERVQREGKAGRTIFPTSKMPEHLRAIHIFVRKTRSKKRGFRTTRAFILAHEFGHVVQHVYLSELSAPTRRTIIEALAAYDHQQGGKGTEGFANWMAAYAATEIQAELNREAGETSNVKDNNVARRRAELAKIAKDLEAPGNTEMQTVLTAMVQNLRHIWKQLKNVWSKKEGFIYPQEFADFVAGFNSHQRSTGRDALPLGSSPKELTTPLARAVFTQLQLAEAGPFLPNELYHQDPKTGEFGRPMRYGDFDTVDFDEAGTAAERAADPLFQKYFDDIGGWWSRLQENQADAGKMLVYTADSELRNMGQVGLWIARQFHALPSSADKSLTVFREIRIRGAAHHSALHTLLNRIPISRIGLWEGMFNKHPSARTVALRAQRDAITQALLLETPESELSADIAPHVMEIRSYLNEMYRWYTEEMGLPLRERKDYYPMMLDSQFIEQNRGEYIRVLREHGNMTEAQAQRHRMKITRDEDGGLNNGFQDDTNTDDSFLGPGATFKKRRAERTIWTPELRKALVDGGFYQHDIATTLIAYTEMMTRRAVWERRYHDPKRTTLDSEGRPVVHATPAEFAAYTDRGLNINHPIAKLQMRLHLAKESGDINQWQFDRISGDILPAYAGQLGLRTNSHIRKISASIVIYQNLRLLSMAVFSSFVDVGTLMARGDSWSNHKPALQLLLSKSGRAEAMIMLEAIGAMRQGLTEHVLNDQALNTFMTGSAKRINDKFFHYNGMEGWTNLMRAMALMSAREFMQRNARVAIEGTGEAKATATRYMNELGFDEAGIQKVRAWDGHSTTDIDIVAGLDRYIDESMIRPDASIRPVWMSDPGYGIFAHLKGFLYGFQETFLRRVGREVKIHQNYLPLLMLGMMALPFAAVGYELRKKVTGSKRSPEGFAYFKEVVERSGLPGAFQLIVDAEQADEFGKPFGLGIGGPAVEQFYDLMTKDFGTVWPKAIPVVAQSPVLRDWVRDIGE